MNKKVFKLIDIIISCILIIYFFRLQAPSGEYEYGLGDLIQLIFLSPSIIILFVSIIMMIIALFNKNSNNVFEIVSQICKILFYITYIFIRKYILHITIKPDILIIVPVLGLIGIIKVCVSKTLKRNKIQ